MFKQMHFAIFLVVNLFNCLALAEASDRLNQLCPFQKNGDLNLQLCQNINLNDIQFSAHQLNQVQNAIDFETNSWADSILETEVDTHFDDERIETTQKVFAIKNNRLLGYSVTFSYLGWDTSCVKSNYDPTLPDTYKNCKKGRIRSAIFISPDFKESETLVQPQLFLKSKK